MRIVFVYKYFKLKFKQNLVSKNWRIWSNKFLPLKTRSVSFVRGRISFYQLAVKCSVNQEHNELDQKIIYNDINQFSHNHISVFCLKDMYLCITSVIESTFQWIGAKHSTNYTRSIFHHVSWRQVGEILPLCTVIIISILSSVCQYLWPKLHWLSEDFSLINNYEK